MTPPHVLSLRERRERLYSEQSVIRQKRCTACRLTKPLDAFAKSMHGGHAHDGTCIACRLARHGRQYLAHLRKRYKLSQEAYTALLEAQGYACAICHITLAELAQSTRHHKHLHVDHDHTTGAVRGLLCDACNHGLGFFRDTLAYLYAAVAYLEQHNASDASSNTCTK